MIDNVEIRLTKDGVNYTLTLCHDYSNKGFTADFINDFANLIAEVVKMSNVDPVIVIERIKEICETENTDNNE